MGVIQDNEYVLYKAVAQHIKSGLEKPLRKLNDKCFKELLKFEKQKALFLNCETFEDLGDNSNKLKSQRNILVSLLAVQDRLEKIVTRNDKRIEFASLRLQQMGIYNDVVDKKTLSSALSAESKNVSEESLNLNPKSNSGITLKFFNGEILAFRDDDLDFELDENRDVLIGGSVDFIHSVVETFPYSVATIPDEYYIYSDLKNKILKECILFVASKMKTQSIVESNNQLGGLLDNVAEITSITHYANELRNYFNVIVKQTLKEQSPEFAEEADSVLKCNELSRFLPKDRKNLSDNFDDELDEIDELSEESETAKIADDAEVTDSQEEQKSDDEGMSTKELLGMLMDDEDDIDSVEEDAEAQDSSEDEIDNLLKELDDLFADSDEIQPNAAITEQKVETAETKAEISVVKDDAKLDAETQNSGEDEIDSLLKDLDNLFADSDESQTEPKTVEPKPEIPVVKPEVNETNLVSETQNSDQTNSDSEDEIDNLLKDLDSLFADDDDAKDSKEG